MYLNELLLDHVAIETAAGRPVGSLVPSSVEAPLVHNPAHEANAQPKVKAKGKGGRKAGRPSQAGGIVTQGGSAVEAGAMLARSVGSSADAISSTPSSSPSPSPAEATSAGTPAGLSLLGSAHGAALQMSLAADALTSDAASVASSSTSISISATNNSGKAASSRAARSQTVKHAAAAGSFSRPAVSLISVDAAANIPLFSSSFSSATAPLPDPAHQPTDGPRDVTEPRLRPAYITMVQAMRASANTTTSSSSSSSSDNTQSAVGATADISQDSALFAAYKQFILKLFKRDPAEVCVPLH